MKMRMSPVRRARHDGVGKRHRGIATDCKSAAQCPSSHILTVSSHVPRLLWVCVECHCVWEYSIKQIYNVHLRGARKHLDSLRTHLKRCRWRERKAYRAGQVGLLVRYCALWTRSSLYANLKRQQRRSSFAVCVAVCVLCIVFWRHPLCVFVCVCVTRREVKVHLRQA